MMMVGAGGPGPRGGGGPGMDRVQMERMQRIAAEAETHPQDALANVATLTSPEMKAQALEQIARVTWKKNPSVAKSALKQLVEMLPQMELQQQVMPARAAASLYLQMGEAGEARKAIEKGLESAAKLYKQDTDAEDPNQALKAYWPSAQAYVGLLRVAGEMSPDWALEQLKEVPDEELRALAQIAMASALLGEPQGPVTIMSEKKDQGTMMQMRAE
jgi:hypothetical protein